MTPEAKGFLLLSMLKLLFVFTVVMVGVALLTLMERKVSATERISTGRSFADTELLATKLETTLVVFCIKS